MPNNHHRLSFSAPVICNSNSLLISSWSSTLCSQNTNNKVEIHCTLSMKYNEYILHIHVQIDNKRISEDDLCASPATTGHDLEPRKPCSMEVLDYCPKSSMFLQQEIPSIISTSLVKNFLLKYTKQDKCRTTYPIPFLLLTISLYKSNFAWLKQKPRIPSRKFPWWMQSWRASSTIIFRGKSLLPRCTPKHERITSYWQSKMRPANDSALYPANTT